MTTIVACTITGIMVGDTFTNYGPVRKIWKSKKGLFGCAGHDTAIARFEVWTRGGKKPEQIINPSDREDFETFCALQMTDGKLYVWTESMRPEEVLRPYHAIGSGGQAALAAMRAGASPTQAMEIAAEMDADTKPPFTTLEA